MGITNLPMLMLDVIERSAMEVYLEIHLFLELFMITF